MQANRVSEEQQINEEYKAWKKNSPFLYELLITHALDWPTLTLQWFPDHHTQDGITQQRLLCGTHTSNIEQNYLQVIHSYIPETLADPRKSTVDSSLPNITPPRKRIQVTKQIKHEGEVNRARYMPQDPNIVVTKAPSGDLYVYDLDPDRGEASWNSNKPQQTLKGHTKEGYGVAWSHFKAGHVISASDDTNICHWDINANTGEDLTMPPLRTYKYHKSVVEDVAWHSKHSDFFGSCGDDHMLLLWDTRDGKKPQHKAKVHNGEVNCLDFNKEHEWLVVTGSVDKTVALWDIRHMSHSLHTFQGHTQDVLQVTWSPHNSAILASAGADRRLLIWDLNDIGAEVDPEFLDDGPPELLFAHAGHTNRISEFSWSLLHPWIIASAGEDNMLQVWSPAADVYNSDIDVNDEDLESRKARKKQ